jgi:hypothetical protein
MITARRIFNILAVCGTAVFTGALMTIGLTLGSYWKSLSPAEFLDWFSKNSHFIGRTLPPCLTARLEWVDVQQRYLWGAALVCVVGLLVITSVYNGPMNSQFASKSVSPDQVPAALNINHVNGSGNLPQSPVGVLQYFQARHFRSTPASARR